MDNTTIGLVRVKMNRLAASFGGLAVMALVLAFVYVYMLQHTVTYYQVFVGTDTIGAVSRPSVVWDWLEQKKASVKQQFPSVQTEVKLADLQFVTERQYKAQYDDAKTIAELDNKVSVRMYGIQIRIDGKPLGYMKNEGAAQLLLDRVKQKYMQTGGKSGQPSSAETTAGSQISEPGASGISETADFVQQVELTRTEVKPEDMADSEDLFQKIETGGTQPLKYKVQPGDCVSCIAYKFHIGKQVIYDNNPSIKNDLIHPGDELDLTVLQPLLSVKTREQQTETVEVPYQETTLEDSALEAGVKETITPGENGLKEVTYVTTRIDGELKEKSKVGEKVIRPMTNAVLKKGTKVTSGVGSGEFAWPVYRAKLTSEFGKRWGAFHPGTDMISDNTAIMAADNGRTSFTGWKSGYGNCVIIDHQNGFSTLYGHLSKILTSAGEIVQKGEKIGIMGTTGNSTGVHLHFEIRKGEEQMNPIRYLGSLK